jgi:hypothetical protein
MFSNITNLEKCQILLGNFYGDGNYQRNLKYENATYILNKHSSKQNDYVKWLEYLYQNMNIYKFSSYNKINNGGFLNGNLISYVAAKPPIINYFESSIFLDINRNKVITYEGLLQLHSFGLLLWFLDDGSLSININNNGSKREARLSTQCYSYEEHKIIKKYFDIIWNIQVRIGGQIHKYTNKYYYRIDIYAKQFKKLFDIIRPYLNLLPLSMKYKFNMKYKDKSSPYNL